MSIFSSLISAAGALSAYSRVLEATQNNVANASTPGYAKQRQMLEPLGFDSDLGSAGGVRASQIVSARDDYAERSVRRQTVLLGQDQQDVASLTALQSVFDISGAAGIPNALSGLFESFSAWGQSPNDTIAKQNVIDGAAGVADAFHQAAAGLANVTSDAERQIQQTVDQINHLAGQLREYNQRALEGNRNDPSLDAQIHSTLEELSQFADITVLHPGDGTATVLLNGETPLVLGDRQFSVRYELAQPEAPPPTYPNARPLARIVTADGADITAHTTGGQLGSLVDFRNHTLPAYIGDAYQAGGLNRMAKQFADSVNLTLGGGAPLFTYDSSNDTAAAQTLSVNAVLTADQLTASDPGPPEVANGIPLALSAMKVPPDYGDMATRVGRALRNATSHSEVQQSAVAQAKNLRQQMSGVSLDEEATILVQFQRAYEATSKLISVLDQLTRDVLDMLRP